MNVLDLAGKCYAALPKELKEKPWSVTEHGCKVLQTDDELNAYVAAYGEMHVVKCFAALQNFPFDDLRAYSFEIFDWGCGQGLATLALLEMLHERGLQATLRKIYLIEPSAKALNRAKDWVTQNLDSPAVNIVAVNKTIPKDKETEMPEVSCASPISINLFSNILDVKGVNLYWLANKTAKLAATNYMICVGPCSRENMNTRLKDFCGYFNPSEYFSKINIPLYAYTTRTNHAYSCETRCFVHKFLTPLDSDYKEYADLIDADVFENEAEYLRDTKGDAFIDFYRKLRKECGSSFDLFLTPSIGLDSVDVLMMSKSRGIVLINTCNDLDKLEEEFNRIEGIKQNFFELYVKNLKIGCILNEKIFGSIKTALFFPKYTTKEVKEKEDEINNEINYEINYEKNNNNERHEDKDYFQYLKIFTPETDVRKVVNSIKASGFKYDYYKDLKEQLCPKWHSRNEGDLNFRLTKRQADIVKSKNKKLRVKGVAGSGKTQVVAYRAVEEHLRTGDKVLILTFNIALIQYIKMLINRVPADFHINKFEVINYHQFFRIMKNKYVANDKILIPKTRKEVKESDNNRSDKKKDDVWESDLPKFFEPYKTKIKKYKSIIVDEVQDFKSEWLDSIITYFHADDGTIFVFGDGEQNIYKRPQEKGTRMPSIPTFTGRWQEMNKRISMRMHSPKIAELASNFSQRFINEVFSPIAAHRTISFDDSCLKYWKRDANSITVEQLTRNIIWIIKEKYKTERRDVAVLAQSIDLLRDIEATYVELTNERPMTTFEGTRIYEELRKKKVSLAVSEVRRAAKAHFTTDCSDIKMSTIQSFKGWEAKTIILLLQLVEEEIKEHRFDKNNKLADYPIICKENDPALIYTALTRAKCNLFIINMGNTAEYDEFFQQQFKQYK